MRCGISTACFYPEETAEALKHVAKLGAPVAEIFLNTFRELEKSYIDKLHEIVLDTGIKISSIHPFTTPLEGFLFATDYESRIEDGIEFYRRYFEICNKLGTDKLIFHGDNRMSPYPLDKYIANLKRLIEIGEKDYGVKLCYENVVYCRLGAADIVSKAHGLLGDQMAFTLDLKQARRRESNLDEMMQAMQGAILQVHISDYSQQNDCIPPGEGLFDFNKFLMQLKRQNYNNDLIIELYREGFENDEQLINAMRFVESKINAM